MNEGSKEMNDNVILFSLISSDRGGSREEFGRGQQAWSELRQWNKEKREQIKKSK